MKKFLTEAQKQTKFEEVAGERPAGVLKVVKGCVADFKPNRNGRIYPKELWQNVISSEYVKEQIESKTLYGEADHPEERTELSLQNVSHAINKLWIDESKQQVWAELHILNTPLGEMISNLLDYGSKIGVSSRGAGSVMSNGQVDPDDYQFFTLDLVARPSVAAARPAIVEGEETLSNEEINNIVDEYKQKSAEMCNNFIYISEGVREALLENTINSLVESCK